jgi:hypothetical protein
MVQDYDVVVAKAEDEGEMARLVCVQCVFQIDDSDEDIVCNNVCIWRGVSDRRGYVGGICIIGGNRGISRMSGLVALALYLHVTHLSPLRFRKILGNIFYVD